jgi:hypothetical protein
MVAAGRKAELELLDSIRLDQRCALHMAGAIRTLRIVAPLLTLDAAPAVGNKKISAHSVNISQKGCTAPAFPIHSSHLPVVA